MHLWRSFLFSIVLLLLTACQPSRSYTPPPLTEDTRTLYVVHYSWHSGIVLGMDDIPAPFIPEKADFPDARHIEIGWGQREFYRARGYNSGMAFRALFVDDASTMYMHGIPSPPEQHYRGSNLVMLRVRYTDYMRMVQMIDASFQRGNVTRATPYPHPYQPNAWFYDAVGIYGIRNTRNHWTANMLHRSGLPMNTTGLLTASEVIKDAATYGTWVLHAP